jgi:hypothetical protein
MRKREMTPSAQARHAHGAGAQHLARRLVTGLAIQFLLGMAVNLLGLPSQATGAARTASAVFLAVHALIALGLISGAAMIIHVTPCTQREHRLAIWGTGAITTALAAGILTLITSSNWWSYGMAAAFIASLLIYGRLCAQPAPPHR